MNAISDKASAGLPKDHLYALLLPLDHRLGHVTYICGFLAPAQRLAGSIASVNLCYSMKYCISSFSFKSTTQTFSELLGTHECNVVHVKVALQQVLLYICVHIYFIYTK